MDNRLYDRRYLAGDEYTIADMISYPWTVGWEGQGQKIQDFPYFKRWFDELSARTSVQRGMAVGKEMTVDTSKMSPDDIKRLTKLLYNQRARGTRRRTALNPAREHVRSEVHMIEKSIERDQLRMVEVVGELFEAASSA